MIRFIPGLRCEHCGGNLYRDEDPLVYGLYTCLMCVRHVKGIKRAQTKAS